MILMGDTIPGQSAAGRRGEAVFEKKNKKFSTNKKETVLLTCIILKFYIQLNYKIFNQRAA